MRQQDLDKRNKIEESIKVATKPNLQELNKLKKQREKFEKPDWKVCENGGGEQIYLFADIANEVKEKSSTYDANLPARKEIDAKIAIEEKKQNTPSTIVDEIAHKLAGWDPYDQNASSPYFDPEWMFNVKDGFDIVVGNPPYGAAIKQEAKKQIGISQSLDSSEYFIFKLFQYVKKASIISLIVPKSIIFARKWMFSRRAILENTLIVISDPGLMFENVNLETFIFVFKNCHCAKNHVVQRSFYDPVKKCVPNKKLSFMTPFPQDIMKESDAFILSNLSIESLKIIEKIKGKNHFIKHINREVFRGIYVSDKEKTKRLNKGNYCFINKVPDVGRFVVNKTHKIDLRGKEFEKKIQKNSVDRIIIKVLRGSRLVCTYVNKNLLSTEKLVNLVVSKSNFSPKYIAGCINSMLCSWYIQKTLFSDITETARVMDDYYLSKCPIPNITIQQQQPIVSRVDRILSAKQADPSADTSALESEIDQLVYQLYGLTDEEIAVVEASSKSKKVQPSVASSEATVAASAEEEDNDDGSDARN